MLYEFTLHHPWLGVNEYGPGTGHADVRVEVSSLCGRQRRTAVDLEAVRAVA